MESEEEAITQMNSFRIGNKRLRGFWGEADEGWGGGDGYRNGRRSDDNITTAAVAPFVVIFGLVGTPTGRGGALPSQKRHHRMTTKRQWRN